MRWKLLSLSLLIILTTTVVLLYHTTQGFETKTLVIYAMRWGTIPENYLELPNSTLREAIISAIKTSSVIGAMEIPEDSIIKNWASSVLGNSSRESINVKIDDEYYRVTIEYLYNRYSYPSYMFEIPLIITILAWCIFIALLVLPHSPQIQHKK